MERPPPSALRGEDFALIRGNLSATEIRQRAAAEQSRGGKLTAIQGEVGWCSDVKRPEEDGTG